MATVRRWQYENQRDGKKQKAYLREWAREFCAGDKPEEQLQVALQKYIIAAVKEFVPDSLGPNWLDKAKELVLTAYCDWLPEALAERAWLEWDTKSHQFMLCVGEEITGRPFTVKFDSADLEIDKEEWQDVVAVLRAMADKIEANGCL